MVMAEVIVLNEGTRGVGGKGVSARKRMACGRGKDSARCGLWSVKGDALRERNRVGSF